MNTGVINIKHCYLISLYFLKTKTLSTKVKTPLRNLLVESNQMFHGRSSEDYLSAQLNNSFQFCSRGKGWREDSSCCWASQPTHTAPQRTHTAHTNTRRHGNAGAATPASAGGARDAFSTSPLPHHERSGAGSTVMMSRRGWGLCSLGGRAGGREGARRGGVGYCGADTSSPDYYPSSS